VNTPERPPPLPGVVRVTRRQTAEWQIDNAIILWFEDEQDVVSPHTLAVAAQGVLTVLCKEMHEPLSKAVTWINQQPKSFREQIRNPQNFFKHGHHKQRFKDVASFTPELTEVFLIDNVAVYQDLFASLTIPMVIFALRFSVVHPKGLPLAAFKFADAKVLEVAEAKKLAGLSRKDFFQAALQLVARRKDAPTARSV
jgi:hypothetical protein